VALVLDSARRRSYNKNKIIIDLQEQIRNLNFVLEAEKRKNISPDRASEKDTHVREFEGEPVLE
jgi:hypothetical protein